MTDEEQLAAAFERLGAAKPQARTMAAQLLRRAAQLAAERGTTGETELARLLALATQGRGGTLPADFVPSPRPPPRQ